jgi:uncharacterized membrane protein
MLGAMAAAWLLFLPNAPYLLTDLVHLPDKDVRHYWADMMLILHFALTGLMLGFVSMLVLHGVVARRFGVLRGWAFSAAGAGLAGLGVYFGRFLRWNSWDVIVRPVDLLADLMVWLASLPSRPAEILLPLLFGSMTFVAYLLFWSLLRPSLSPESGGRPDTTARAAEPASVREADGAAAAAVARQEWSSLPNSI